MASQIQLFDCPELHDPIFDFETDWSSNGTVSIDPITNLNALPDPVSGTLICPSVLLSAPGDVQSDSVPLAHLTPEEQNSFSGQTAENHGVLSIVESALKGSLVKQNSNLDAEDSRAKDEDDVQFIFSIAKQKRKKKPFQDPHNRAANRDMQGNIVSNINSPQSARATTLHDVIGEKQNVALGMPQCLSNVANTAGISLTPTTSPEENMTSEVGKAVISTSATNPIRSNDGSAETKRKQSTTQARKARKRRLKSATSTELQKRKGKKGKVKHESLTPGAKPSVGNYTSSSTQTQDLYLSPYPAQNVSVPPCLPASSLLSTKSMSRNNRMMFAATPRIHHYLQPSQNPSSLPIPFSSGESNFLPMIVLASTPIDSAATNFQANLQRRSTLYSVPQWKPIPTGASKAP